ncbi:MAG TPA: sulfatase-like hydrolase/transferase [Edaphobacter sp.]|nr:sulfatase-like hydrolase/transferase [Edaphobacter sp.]
MNRRHFLGVASGAIFAGGISTSDAQQPADRSFTQPRSGVGPYRKLSGGNRPNIFLISADMVSPDLYHPDRPLSRQVRLPNIQSLMADGTFFSNAFCTVPLCAPSRASYLTGRYSYIQGNGERAPEGLETQLRPTDIIFPEYLKASGYLTRQAGKAHVGTQKFIDTFGENDNPWDRWSPPVYDDDGYLAYQRSLGVKPQKYSREIVFRMQDRKTPGNSAGGWIVQEDGKPFPFEAHYSCYLAHRAVETLRSLVETENPSKHPIYLQLDIFDPHQPFSIPDGYQEREKELRRTIKLPESYISAKNRDFKRADYEPEILDVYRKYWGLYDEQALLDYRVAYILQMELVDRAIGIFLEEIRKLGLYDNAMIALISDHGEMNGRRAMVDKGVYLYPDVLRVPLVIKPSGGSHVKRVDDSVSLLDLSQTLLDAAGIQPEAKFDGISLLPAVGGKQVTRPNRLLFFGGWHVGVNFACGLEHHTPDGRHFLYAYNCSSPNDELYDMKSVDAENLIDKPEYASIREQMIRLLAEELQRDPRWIGFWAEFRVARYNLLPKTNGDMQLFSKPS